MIQSNTKILKHNLNEIENKAKHGLRETLQIINEEYDGVASLISIVELINNVNGQLISILAEVNEQGKIYSV